MSKPIKKQDNKKKESIFKTPSFTSVNNGVPLKAAENKSFLQSTEAISTPTETMSMDDWPEVPEGFFDEPSKSLDQMTIDNASQSIGSFRRNIEAKRSDFRKNLSPDQQKLYDKANSSNDVERATSRIELMKQLGYESELGNLTGNYLGDYGPSSDKAWKKHFLDTQAIDKRKIETSDEFKSKNGELARKPFFEAGDSTTTDAYGVERTWKNGSMMANNGPTVYSPVELYLNDVDLQTGIGKKVISESDYSDKQLQAFRHVASNQLKGGNKSTPSYFDRTKLAGENGMGMFSPYRKNEITIGKGAYEFDDNGNVYLTDTYNWDDKNPRNFTGGGVIGAAQAVGQRSMSASSKGEGAKQSIFLGDYKSLNLSKEEFEKLRTKK